eukprot:scaffold8553_cov111-Amphora_coffeaeformis.AAC.2
MSRRIDRKSIVLSTMVRAFVASLQPVDAFLMIPGTIVDCKMHHGPIASVFHISTSRDSRSNIISINTTWMDSTCARY